jgi:hypothetical protein
MQACEHRQRFTLIAMEQGMDAVHHRLPHTIISNICHLFAECPEHTDDGLGATSARLTRLAALPQTTLFVVDFEYGPW